MEREKCYGFFSLKCSQLNENMVMAKNFLQPYKMSSPRPYRTISFLRLYCC